MSLKQDVEYIKQEIDTEEKFLSTMAHAERFWKQFKRPLIGIGAAFVLGIGSYYSFEAYSNYKIDSANAILNKLLANPSDKALLDELKAADSKLYEAYSLYANASSSNVNGLKELSNAQAKFVAELANYQSAAIEKNNATLQEIGNNKDAIMRDLSLIDSGVLAMQKNDFKTASSLFAKVPQNSIAKPEAVALEHFSQTVK